MHTLCRDAIKRKKSHYLTTYDRKLLAQSIITTYPFLKDSLGPGYQSWLEPINNCLKRINQKDGTASKRLPSECDRVAGAPKKITLKSYKGVPNDLNYEPPHEDGEDDTSNEAHKETMRREMYKRVKDMKLIEALCQRTYSFRRNMINECEENLLQELNANYPFSLTKRGIEIDFSLLTSENCLNTGLGNKAIFEKVTCYAEKLGRGKKFDASKRILLDMYKEIEEDPENLLNIRIIAGLQLLPILLNEDSDYFLQRSTQ